MAGHHTDVVAEIAQPERQTATDRTDPDRYRVIWIFGVELVASRQRSS